MQEIYAIYCASTPAPHQMNSGLANKLQKRYKQNNLRAHKKAKHFFELDIIVIKPLPESHATNDI